MHNDETTPHMHLNLMPVTKDGRLCSKQLFDKSQLQQLQTDFYESVGKRWGLQRGKEGSQKKHLSTAEFKAKKIIEQAEAIREGNQVYADALTEAKSGNIPRKRGKLQEQVIALSSTYFLQMHWTLFDRNRQNRCDVWDQSRYSH